MRDFDTNPPAAVRAAQDLAALAREINDEHADAVKTARQTVEYMQNAGVKLIQAKDLCVRTWQPWLSWLKHNCPDIHERTAERYMAIARGKVARHRPTRSRVTGRRTSTSRPSESPSR
jgi:hypothetical protein